MDMSLTAIGVGGGLLETQKPRNPETQKPRNPETHQHHAYTDCVR